MDFLRPETRRRKIALGAGGATRCCCYSSLGGRHLILRLTYTLNFYSSQITLLESLPCWVARPTSPYSPPWRGYLKDWAVARPFPSEVSRLFPSTRLPA